MKSAKITVMAAVFLVCASVKGFTGTLSFGLEQGGYNSVPEPRLRYPIYDTVELAANTPLEFKWWNNYNPVRGFIFKLYKGYDMYAANLLIKEDLPADACSFKAGEGIFENGQVYTWSLVQVSYAGYKSDRSFNSFKVIKSGRGK